MGGQGGAVMDSKVLVNIGEQRFDKMVGDKKLYRQDRIYQGMVGEWFDGDADHASAQVWQDAQYEHGRVLFFNPICG